jgi:hypothetical protein
MAKYRYAVSIFKPDHGEWGTFLNFFTERIGINLADSRSTNSVADEAAGRAVLGKIMAHKQLSIGVADDIPYLIHQFHLLPLDQPILDVTVDLERITPRSRSMAERRRPDINRRLPAEVAQTVASLKLGKVSLLGFPANKDEESYTANLRVTGKAELASLSKVEN